MENVKTVLSEMGFEPEGNPDFRHFVFDTMSVDDARALAEAETNRSFSGGKKIFVIEANTITEEAQNALLKVFEEPAPGTHFFLLLPSDILLPTLLSRLSVERISAREVPPDSLLSMSLGEKLKAVKTLSDDITAERKTKEDAIRLVLDIETSLHREGTSANATRLAVCEKVRQSLQDRGAPVKMILEHLMLSI